MDLGQLLKFETLNEEISAVFDFVAELYMKEYPKKIDIKASDFEATRQKIIEVHGWALGRKDQFPNLSAQLLKAYLMIGLEHNILEKERFFEYLNSPVSSLDISYKLSLSHARDLKKKEIMYDPKWLPIHGLAIKEGPYGQELSFLEAYIEKLFSRGLLEVDQIADYFQFDYITKLYYKTQLQLGTVVEDLTECFSTKEITQLRNEKYLRFASFNKIGFNNSEPVILSLEIKNIPYTVMNIFEINTKHYYFQHYTDLDSEVDLEGLIPRWSYTFDLTENPPMLSYLKDFDCSELTQVKEGLFIVEFVGGGLKSRACIRKGCLSLVRCYDQASTGPAFYVMDQNKKLRIKDTYIL
jgi:hypothetical protein